MHDLWTALALVFVIEGSLWCLLPRIMKRAASFVVSADVGGLRVAGLLSTTLGVVLVWLIRG